MNTKLIAFMTCQNYELEELVRKVANQLNDTQILRRGDHLIATSNSEPFLLMLKLIVEQKPDIGLAWRIWQSMEPVTTLPAITDGAYRGGSQVYQRSIFEDGESLCRELTDRDWFNSLFDEQFGATVL